jgi:hypothetical protein
MTIQEVIRLNRASLAKEPAWLPDDKLYSSSLYQYGVPGGYRKLMNQKIGNNAMISDLLGYLALSLPDPVSFFEIGVSTGKTTYQMMSLLPPSAVIGGIDMENINPPLANLLSNRQQVSTWTGKDGRRKGLRCGVDKYDTGKGQTYYYVTADTSDELAWENLAKEGVKFQLVYSDSGSDSNAIQREWGKMLKNKLGPCRGEDPWFIVFDDMNDDNSHPMNMEVLSMQTECQARSSTPIYIKFIAINGWVGELDGKHRVAVMANVDLSFLPDEKGYPDSVIIDA